MTQKETERGNNGAKAIQRSVSETNQLKQITTIQTMKKPLICTSQMMMTKQYMK